MNQSAELSKHHTSASHELARCVACGQSIWGDERCLSCGRVYPCRDGIFEAIGTLSGRNKIVADFYDGPGWVKFRPWEQAFLIFQGGIRKARMEILRHALGGLSGPAHGLEVGIGAGENLRFLPSNWKIHGIDIARSQLDLCRRRHPQMNGRLTWAEGEVLPFADATFDASWSVGGFNYYRDHEACLREMRRVTKPGSPVVVADELPSLHHAGLGHLIGFPAFDAWWLYKLGLDREFVDMVLSFDIDLKALFRRIWPDAAVHRIWHGLGYCLVNTSGT